MALQQAAKSSAVGAKGGAAAAERLKKELDKTRCPPPPERARVRKALPACHM